MRDVIPIAPSALAGMGRGQTFAGRIEHPSGQQPGFLVPAPRARPLALIVEHGRAFWQQMDTLVETLDGLVVEGAERG